MSAAPDAGPPGLRRSLGRFDVVALSVNSVVGAGVLAMPAELAADAGRLSLAVILAAFVVVSLLALSLAEVASRYDETGGPQLYAERTFGPASGFTVGWLLTVSRLASTAVIAQVMVNYAAELAPALAAPGPRVAAITASMLLLTVINVRGVQGGAWTGNVLTVVKLVPLALIAIAGLAFAGWNALPAAEPRPGGLLNAMNVALFACVGFDVATVVAGEMRNPRRDLPASILGGLAISCVLYFLLMLACFGVLPDTAASKLPLVDVAERLAGQVGATGMAIAAVISCAGGLAVQMLVTPRNVYALGEAGDLPRASIAVHGTWRTPWVAIVATAALSWLLAITGTFEYLLGLFVISRMLAHGSTAAALIALRRREGPAPLPIPGGIPISVLAIAACVALAALAPREQLRDVAIVVAAGFLVRAVVRRRLERSTVRSGG